MNYKSSGVDVEAGYESVRLMKSDVERTRIPGVIGAVGGFGGLFMPNFAEYKEPVLVSGTDGVGTKLKLAFLLDKHDTVGVDCVAMCVNDVICCGAKPLFFLDYINCGKNIPEKTAAIIKGIADGCVKAGCALIGGETAEHPGLTPENEYDLAGFCVGIVEKSKIISGSDIKAGDAIIGLASTGVHSNGFSLIRKVFDINENIDKKLGETLLTPTEIYVKPVLDLISKVHVKGLAHITGGGFYENIPRCLNGLTAKINKNSYEIPEIFKIIAQKGGVTERDMYNTFNMGIGMVAVVDNVHAGESVNILEKNGVKAYKIGEVTKGEELIIS